MKNYVKPLVAFDSFELAESVTAGCDIISPRTQVSYVCPVEIEDLGTTIFIESGGCFYTPQEGEFNICYDIPLEGNRIFIS